MSTKFTIKNKQGGKLGSFPFNAGNGQQSLDQRRTAARNQAQRVRDQWEQSAPHLVGGQLFVIEE